MKNQLLEWKSKYGVIYHIDLEDKPVYYRTLNGWEIQSVQELKKSNKAKVDVEMAILLMAILHPTPLPEFKKPGTVSTLALEIWKNHFQPKILYLLWLKRFEIGQIIQLKKILV